MTELEKCRKAVEEMRSKALTTSETDTEFIGKMCLVDKVKEIVRLKEERIEIIEGQAEYDRDRLMEIADKQLELMREIKEHGMPYHPVMGNQSDWEAIQT